MLPMSQGRKTATRNARNKYEQSRSTGTPYQPVAGISGLPRSPAHLIDVILLGSIAEELIFRVVIWSILTRLSQKNSWIITLVGTSLLFGVMHFGYWAQSGWIFQPEAVFHVISMVFAGAFLGAVLLDSRSLAAAMIVHMLVNAAILLTQ
jgi:membrane protease YdiL (CAAX protease family)